MEIFFGAPNLNSNLWKLKKKKEYDISIILKEVTKCQVLEEVILTDLGFESVY